MNKLSRTDTYGGFAENSPNKAINSDLKKQAVDAVIQGLDTYQTVKDEVPLN